MLLSRVAVYLDRCVGEAHRRADWSRFDAVDDAYFLVCRLKREVA